MTKKTARPKRHHFIPQMMLRHFADDDGQLWFWRRDLMPGDTRKTSTQNLFVEKDLYTFVQGNGEKDVALETFFSNLEGVGAAFINGLAAIVRGGREPELDAGAWEFWSHFFYFHLKRTPGAIAAFAEQMNFDELVRQTAAKIKAIRLETGGDANEENLEEKIRKNATVMAQAAKPSAEVLAAFEQMGLAIYKVANSRKSFIVTDVPGATARFKLPDGSMSKPTLFVPLTWDIAVGQLAGGRRVEVVTVDADQVRRMNEASAARSLVIAGRSAELIGSLAKMVPYRGVERLEEAQRGAS
ncbi:MAG: DUF4238 domain-containing protein [Novosphingobium meiothermophilum]|uniref:DUF4238 domain-containing protein n=1 Tax=Novosphingobium meiothermophilum TaxID=2202251 RepID=UPI000D6E8456|nr:DUF4238 domain-containing protein [Novosphingobium meiothermophilum]